MDKPMMEWFYANLTNSAADMQDLRLDIVGKADLKGLPPATVITAQIDPLRSEGQALADKLKAAGGQVDAYSYDGVTHEFFGMGLIVAKAKEAEDVAVKNLKCPREVTAREAGTGLPSRESQVRSSPRTAGPNPPAPSRAAS